MLVDYLKEDGIVIQNVYRSSRGEPTINSRECRAEYCYTAKPKWIAPRCRLLQRPVASRCDTGEDAPPSPTPTDRLSVPIANKRLLVIALLLRKIMNLKTSRLVAALYCVMLAGLSLTACSDRSAPAASTTVAKAPPVPSGYNEMLAAIAPLAPKSEVETSKEFAERKRQRLAHLAGLRFSFTVPVSLGKCRVPEGEELAQPRDFIGLRYNADAQMLEVCVLDKSFAPASGEKRSYGMLVTDATTKKQTLIGETLLQKGVTIEERVTKGVGIFVDLPNTDARKFASERIPMGVPAAKDLLANGARLVYDVVLDPVSTGDLLVSDLVRRPNMARQDNVEEHIAGVAAKVQEIKLESTQGALIARFELNTDSMRWHGLALIPDVDSRTDPGKATATRYGVLLTGDGGVYLDGRKVIGPAAVGALEVVALRRLGTHDIVVAEEASGGSAGFVSIVLLDVAPEKTVTAYRDDTTGTRGFSDPVSQLRNVGNSIVYDLGFRNGKLQRTVFDGKVIKSALLDVGATPIANALCQLVHAVLQNCAERRDPAGECSKTFDKLSNAESRGIYDAFAYPARIEERFRAECDNACAAGKAPGLAMVKESLCAANLP